MKKAAFLILFLVIFSCAVCDAGAEETIRVLIVNEAYPRVPAKNETLEKLGSMQGDLLVMGTRYTGNIDIWKGKNGLYIINELPMETYVKDVVAAEVSADWDMEALKAQAVISRTYALFQKRMNGGGLYHIASSVLDQVYKGNSPDERISAAVEQTKGEILTYNGKPIQAFYHSTSNGCTENPEEVFGKSYPYLRSVESNCDISPYSVWERKIKLSEIEEALDMRGIRKITIKSYTSAKRVKELSITGNSGVRVIRATDFRKALGWSRLPSTNFSLNVDGDSAYFEGKGYGHGVGLCQWCALAMAREGKNYREILAHFYPGTTLQQYENR